jgi:phytoene synthase
MSIGSTLSEQAHTPGQAFPEFYPPRASSTRLFPIPLQSEFADDADRKACRAMICNGSKSFYAASLLLPRKVRQAAYALYAFCRLSDDLVDVEGGSAGAIARLRERLDQAYRGQPANNSVDRVFADVVAQYALPRDLPEALIEGLEWDVAGVACEDLSDVRAYGARVAGSVGAMMTVLMGVRTPAVLARACDLGVAMQLTNIARDVGEDARNGRLYLPRSWMREEGIDPDNWLAAPRWEPGIARLVARLLREADVLYRRAEEGIGGLPLLCRPGIFAARHLYAAIGLEIARNRWDSVSQRAHVPLARKLRLMARALFDAALLRRMEVASALPETQYLVDAVLMAAPVAKPSVTDRILWVAELFVALQDRPRMRIGA